jgi:hypothetical protein
MYQRSEWMSVQPMPHTAMSGSYSGPSQMIHNSTETL